ncbi:MAG: YraN family protein [Sphingomonadaceae bacterium]|uniref:YraN family protein n=1 Tax=Thermaurantiacus sp. TaxID=2820283 RepID=UPI00298F24B0|nr:YraN family protein [Thermaurantiacus sp.]MCS6986939.1 YraN family protein [Sphingomonadaceae bacterium]MDW8415461.1 YraN family protein [Thermaurantiacus sp.]
MTRRGQPDRRAAERRGRWAERLACLWLWLRGYRILGTRLRRPPIEIDILARQGDTLVVVEVKRRPTLEAAMAALTPQAYRRLLAAADRLARAEAWRRRGTARSVAANARVDLIALAPGRWPRHIRDIRP